MPRPRALYIAGLSRSGSTILQRYLATHPDFVSVGESLSTIRVLTGEVSWDSDWPCSCGRLRTECEFWGPLISPLASAGVEGGHALLLKRFHSLHRDKILIDSSKDRRGLKLYMARAEAGEIELQVVFLVRDVRSWASAIRKYRPRGSSYVLEAYRWMTATLNTLRVLRSMEVACYCLSYESFVFHPEQQIQKLAAWLGVENHFSEDRMAEAATHELFGSPTARSAARRDRLAYDDAWLHDGGPALLGPLLVPPLLLNRYIYWHLAGKPMGSGATAVQKAAPADRRQST